MSDSIDINSIHDEDELYNILTNTEDFDLRKRIRTRMREIREAKSAEITRQIKEREGSNEDAVLMRQRQAEAAKQRRLAEYDQRAKEGKKDSGLVEQGIRDKHAQADAEKQKKLQEYTEMGKVMAQVYHAGTDVLMKAEDDQQERLKELNEEEVSRNTKTEKGADGGTMTTNTTVTTHRTRDGPSTTVKQTKQITQTSGLGGTSYKVSKTTADEVAQKLSQAFQGKAVPTTSGVIQVKTEQWSSKDGLTKRTEKTQAWGSQAKSGPRGARAAFEQMDKANGPPAAKPNFLRASNNETSGGGRVGVQRSPSAIKQMLLDWCKAMTREYEPKVSITNFSSSWNDGMAFCALIHHFYPNAFKFEELNPKSRRHNFTLAFETAEKEADIVPLLDVDDMVRMKNPDWKCVFCYVQSFYRRLRAQSVAT